ncbi:MAG: helicase-associated domain-containing protein, partial [Firmicutes bacterium]|nr:helicase-associated domain-containing protein [Bacillota bacterium]
MSNSALRKPLIIQNDLTILLEVSNPQFEAARDSLAGFAELVKSPEHVHTYRLSALSLWNAVAAGYTAEQIVHELSLYSQYDLPQTVRTFIEDQGHRYGRLRLLAAPDGDGLWLTSDEAALLTQIGRNKTLQTYLSQPLHPGYRIAPEHRGVLKQALARIGWPADDQAGYSPGIPLTVSWKPATANGEPFAMRSYQADAVHAFWGNGALNKGNGVVVLPCGAGKTIVGMGALIQAQTHTLILGTSIASLHQWRQELLDKTDLRPDQIGEYSAQVKELRPITLTTYQLLSRRQKGAFQHFAT